MHTSQEAQWKAAEAQRILAEGGDDSDEER